MSWPFFVTQLPQYLLLLFFRQLMYPVSIKIGRKDKAVGNSGYSFVGLEMISVTAGMLNDCTNSNKSGQREHARAVRIFIWLYG